VRLVLCDDHLLLLEALVDALTSAGHTVQAIATDPADAVEQVASLKPDVCVLDLAFPQGSGLAAAREIASRAPETKILILSAAQDPVAVREAFDIGVLGFVRKDSSIEGILKSLDRLADGQVAISAQLMRAAMSATRRTTIGTSNHDISTPLTPREHEVLSLIVAGNDTIEMARSLHVSASTARSHVQNVLIKLGVHSRLQAAALAVSHELVAPLRGS
jgi:two-component system nitrate/nitrite response regulator NarL